MKWKDSLWAACSWTFNTAIELTSDIFNGVGTLACVIGGAGFGASVCMDETLKASYYGGANATGQVNVDLDVISMSYSFKETIPFQDEILSRNGEKSFNLTDYLDPSTVRLASLVLVSSGMALRNAGASLKLWQQGRIDIKFQHDNNGVDVKGPSLKEYMLANVSSALSSITYITLSGSIITNALYFSGLTSSGHTITYPLHGSNQINTTNYEGPLDSERIPFQFALNQTQLVTLPYVNMSVLVDEIIKANATINASYGGRLLLQPRNEHDNPTPYTAIPVAAAATAYTLNRFFSQRIIEERDKRIHQSEKDKYEPINHTV